MVSGIVHQRTSKKFTHISLSTHEPPFHLQHRLVQIIPRVVVLPVRCIALPLCLLLQRFTDGGHPRRSPLTLRCTLIILARKRPACVSYDCAGLGVDGLLVADVRRVFEKYGGHAAGGLCGYILACFAGPPEYPCRVGPECWDVVAGDGWTIGYGTGCDNDVGGHAWRKRSAILHQ